MRVWRIEAVVVAAVMAASCGSDEDFTIVDKGPAFTITPSVLALGVGATQRISVVSGSIQPQLVVAFTVADSCVVRVNAAGDVTGVGSGMGVVNIRVKLGSQTVVSSVPVTVAEPAVMRLTFQSVFTGSPPQPVDLGAVRGTIAVVANVDIAAYQDAELRLAGRTVERRGFLLESAVPGAVLPVGFVVNTAARDSTGQALYPNGPQALEIIGTRRPYAMGCPAGTTTSTLPLNVTIANP